MATTDNLALAERLRRYSPAESGCWLWTGSLTGGYGQVPCIVDGKKTSRRAHRLIYEALRGPIPTGMQLDHLDRVRRCVNPDHLEIVDAKTNTLRSPIAVTSVNSRKTHCAHGHPLIDGNLRRDRGWRECVRCRAAYRKAYKARQKALLPPPTEAATDTHGQGEASAKGRPPEVGSPETAPPRSARQTHEFVVWFSELMPTTSANTCQRCGHRRSHEIHGAR